MGVQAERVSPMMSDFAALCMKTKLSPPKRDTQHNNERVIPGGAISHQSAMLVAHLVGTHITARLLALGGEIHTMQNKPTPSFNSAS